MGIGDYIAIAIITVVVAFAVIYIVRQKKKGVKCIGCQHSCGCNNCKSSGECAAQSKIN